MAALPLLFVVQATVAVEFLENYSYDLINFPLYMVGLTACGLIYFNFYNFLVPGLFQRNNASVFKVTNLQVMTLLLMVFGIIFATKDKGISRLFVGIYLILSYVMLFQLNRFMPRFYSRMFFRGGSLRRCMVIGGRVTVKRLDEWFKEKESLGLNLIGLVAPDSKSLAEAPGDYLGEADNLGELINTHAINQLLLTETRHSRAWVSRVMQIADENGCQVLIYNPWAEYFDNPLSSVRDGPHTFFVPREEPLESPINRLVKRVIDVAISLPIVCLILPLLALWVRHQQRKESPGPVLFRQVRRGHNRTTFVLYKFRSMGVENDDEARQATASDARVFPFGAFMRRTSIDEFPQFINVLRGEMSVVGPRPHIPDHDQLFGKEVRTYAQRHFVKPGLTGLAQVNGFRGEITDPDLIHRRIAYDLEYIADWSVWLDLDIISRTMVIILRPPSTAY
ncbi:MAG: exopolysaccharide biosynthesis polyprenyl glycosylphosphotransferase [Puniceicoccales bacterium]